MVGLSRDCAVCGRRFYFSFWLIFAKAKIKRDFRTLRSPAQGSALRTRGLLEKAGENFISPAGGNYRRSATARA